MLFVNAGPSKEHWIAPLLSYTFLACMMALSQPDDGWVRRSVVVVFDLLTLRYHYWRITATLVPLSLALPALLIDGFYGLEFLTALIAWRSRQVLRRVVDRSPDVERNLNWYGASPPAIWILIPTRNENAQILEKTIAAATRQNYSNYQVWVLDDGQREWVRELCARADVGYVTRSCNRFFKAGNLNEAIKRIRADGQRADFYAVLDADFIAKPEFLPRTLALMNHERVAIVQTPQHFRNPDPFQYAFKAYGAWPEDQRSFFDFRLPSLDAEGRATCCGTSFLLRAEALEEVGGFPSESVCEDTLLSIKLRARQWDTIYLNESLSVGLSPEGLSEFLGQRARWHLGGIQILLYRWSALGTGLQLAKRGRIIESLLRLAVPYLTRLVWLTLPAVYWLTGLSVWRGSASEVLDYAVPVWGSGLAFAWLSRGTILPIFSDAVTLLLAPLYLRVAAVGLFRRKGHSFVVTRKGINRERTVVHWRSLGWLSGLALLLGGAFLLWACGNVSKPQSDRFLLWNLCATYYSLSLLLLAIGPCIERPKYRRAERYACAEPVGIWVDGRRAGAEMKDLSEGGARLTGPDLSKLAALELDLSPELRLHARVVRRIARDEVGIEFTPALLDRGKLIQLIYCSGRYVPTPRRWSFLNCARAALRTALT